MNEDVRKIAFEPSGDFAARPRDEGNARMDEGDVDTA